MPYSVFCSSLYPFPAVDYFAKIFIVKANLPESCTPFVPSSVFLLFFSCIWFFCQNLSCKKSTCRQLLNLSRLLLLLKTACFLWSFICPCCAVDFLPNVHKARKFYIFLSRFLHSFRSIHALITSRHIAVSVHQYTLCLCSYIISYVIFWLMTMFWFVTRKKR